MRRPTAADIPALVAVHRASRFAAYAHLGTPEEAAGGILMMASPLAGYVTGHTLEVTGGSGI